MGGGARHDPYQRVLVPSDALGLVGVGVGEARNLTALAAEEAVEGRTDLVALAFLEGVALRAARLSAVSVVSSSTRQVAAEPRIQRPLQLFPARPGQERRTAVGRQLHARRERGQPGRPDQAHVHFLIEAYHCNAQTRLQDYISSRVL